MKNTQMRFPIWWATSYAAPALLWIALSTWMHTVQVSLQSLFDITLAAATWIAVGFGQAYLLRDTVERNWAWCLFTAIGGMTSLVILRFHSSGYIILSLSLWTPLASVGLLRGFVIGMIVGGSLGLFQVVVLRGNLRERFIWMLVCCVAGSFALGIPLAILRVLFLWIDSSWFLAIGMEHAKLVFQTIRIVGGAVVFGLITGYAAQRLLWRDGHRWNEALIGQFD